MICLNKMCKRKCRRNIKEIKFEEVNLSDFIIIDVRSRREFKETHLNGAINIPLPEIRRSAERYIRNKQSKILVCCEYGIRSKQAVSILENMGYTQVYNLKGGLENI